MQRFSDRPLRVEMNGTAGSACRLGGSSEGRGGQYVDRDAHREVEKRMEGESLPVCLLPGYSGWDRRKTGLD